MLSDIINGNFDSEYFFPKLIAYVIILFFALPFHECAHALVAYRLGDPTAKYKGRVTLNPFAHLDFLGTLCLVFVGFGWAKPVPVNPLHFKNRKAGEVLTAAAGPISNLLLSFLSVVISKLLIAWGFFGGGGFLFFLGDVFETMAMINLYLCLFNLLPVPPLDGSRILYNFLPEKIQNFLFFNQKYISLGLFFILVSGIFSGFLSKIAFYIYLFFDYITSFIELLWRGRM